MPRLSLVPVVLLLACSRDNTVFILADEPGASTTTGEAPTGEAPTGEATTGEAPTSAGSTATGDLTTEAATTEPPRLCEPSAFELGLDLTAKLDDVVITPPPGCAPQVFKGKGSFSASALEIVVNDCQDAPGATLRVETSFLNDVVWPLPSECFVVELAWAEDCASLRSAVIWQFEKGDVFLGIVGVSGSPEPPSGAELIAPTVELVPDGACDCEGSSSECCRSDALDPGAYQLRFPDAAGTILQEGDPPAPKAEFGDLRFYLVNMRSHAHARCEDDAPVHLDWYAVRTF